MRTGPGSGRRRRSAVGCVVAAVTIALAATAFGSPAAAPGPSSQEAAAKKKGAKVVGCNPGGPVKAQSPPSGPVEACTGTDVEAWYHMTPGSTLPPDAPLEQLPEQNPQYPEKTLHVGQRLGEEESRTYITLDLSSVPVTATVQDVIVYLPLDPDGGTAEPRAASFRACLVSEPPQEDKEGSLEQTPEAECSQKLASAPATFEEKPRPHFQLALGELSDSLNPTVGIALVPNKTETQRTKTWHLAFYGRKNKDKDAEPISALISFQESEPPVFDPPADSTLGSGSSPPDVASGGFAAPPPTGFSSGGAPPGTIDSVTGSQPQAPAEAGQTVFAAEPTATRIDPDAYAVKWLVPLALLLGVAFWSSVLNREIKIPPR